MNPTGARSFSAAIASHIDAPVDRNIFSSPLLHPANL
jgi:hypothetical protein